MGILHVPGESLLLPAGLEPWVSVACRGLAHWLDVCPGRLAPGSQTLPQARLTTARPIPGQREKKSHCSTWLLSGHLWSQETRRPGPTLPEASSPSWGLPSGCRRK